MWRLPLAQNLPSEVPPEVAVVIVVVICLLLISVAGVLYGMVDTLVFFIRRIRQRKKDRLDSN